MATNNQILAEATTAVVNALITRDTTEAGAAYIAVSTAFRTFALGGITPSRKAKVAHGLLHESLQKSDEAATLVALRQLRDGLLGM